VLPGPDWRSIHFNNVPDTAGGSVRLAPVSSSGIGFSEIEGGMLELGCWPYDVGRGMHDFTRGVSLHISGESGMFFSCDQGGTDIYHHLFECWRPGATTWPMLRNNNGAFIHHTPVLITSDTTSTPSMNYQNLPVRPNIGDDSTWMLVVNGAALFKEAWVNTSDWPDYVFESSYTLTPLAEVEAYIAANHHLAGIPPADSVLKGGIALGQTEAKMMQKIEELTLYVIQQEKEIETLKSEVHELNQKGK
jgi:hypothetical protein